MKLNRGHIEKSLLSFAFLSLLLFIIFVLLYSFNIPYAPDDVKIFLNQFESFKNNTKSFVDYYFGITLFPHPKLMSRLLADISYVTTGNINFRLIQIFGNIGWLALIPIFYLLSKKKSVYLLVALILLFAVPIHNTFWTISIGSLPFFYLFAILLILLIKHERYYFAIPCYFIAVFTSGQGFLVTIPLGLHLLLELEKHRKITKRHLLWILAICGTMALWYFQIYSLRPQSNQDLMLQSKSNIIEKFIYFLNFLSSAIGSLIVKISPRLFILSTFLSFFIFLHFLYLAIRKQKASKNNTQANLVSLLVIVIGLLACFTRLDDKGSFEIIPNRYVIHSVIFLSCYMILLFEYYAEHLSKLNRIILVAIMIFVFRSFVGYPEMKLVKNYKTVRLTRSMLDQLDQNNNFDYLNNLNNHIQKGIYQPPSYLLSKGMKPVSKAKILNRKTDVIFMEKEETELALFLQVFVELKRSKNYTIEFMNSKGSSLEFDVNRSRVTSRRNLRRLKKRSREKKFEKLEVLILKKDLPSNWDKIYLRMNNNLIVKKVELQLD